MTIKAGQWPAFIVMILFWLYFSGLSNRIIRKKYLITWDWSQYIPVVFICMQPLFKVVAGNTSKYKSRNKILT